MSLNIQVKLKDKTKALKEKAKKASFKNLFQAGGFIRITARRSLRVRKNPSPPGQPPHPPTRQLRESIVFKVNSSKDTVFVGPQRSDISTIGAVHEFGLVHKKTKFKERPFMGPSFTKALPRISKRWAGSVR